MSSVIRVPLLLIACVAASVAGCGNRPDASSAATGSGSEPLGGRDLHVLSAEPGDRAVQVAIDQPVTVDFDGPIAIDSLDTVTTGFFARADGARVATTYSVADAGHRITFAPSEPLDRESDYEFRLDPLTCDTDGRLLDEDVVIRFRTLDESPPVVTGFSHAGSGLPMRVDEPLVVTFDDELDPAGVDAETVTLRDPRGRPIAFDPEVLGDRLLLRPVQDVAGGSEVIVGIRGVRDRSGNRQSQGWSERARAAADTTPPVLLHAWPADAVDVSPRLTPRFRFSETVIPSDEGFAIGWIEHDGEPIAHGAIQSRDGRTLWLTPAAPLVPGQTYTATVSPERSPVLDTTGLSIVATETIRFTVGTDESAPRLAWCAPADGAEHVAPYTIPRLVFDEALDESSLDASVVRLLDPAGATVPAEVSLDPADRRIVVVAPTAALATATAYRLRVRGGLEGLRDRAGNPLASDLLCDFVTSDSPSPPTFTVWPTTGNAPIAPQTTFVVAASEPLDATTIDARRFALTDAAGRALPARVSTRFDATVVRIEPEAPLTPGEIYHLLLIAGPDGIRARSGNWATDPIDRRFEVGFRADTLAPRPAVTIEDIAPARTTDRAVPTSGFALQVTTLDGLDPSFDPTSVELTIEAGGMTLTSSDPAASLAFAIDSMRMSVSAPHALPIGTARARATAADLSGNRSAIAELSFVVAETAATVTPFERTQVVWVRFDLDRDGNGRSDFEDDMLRLGLCAAGDDSGLNPRMLEIVRDGVLARCRELYGRHASGGPRDDGAVAIRLTAGEPRGVTHMQIAVGGLDPEGVSSRRFGDASTGTLGRAWYDYRNDHTNDLAIGTEPGLGVFPGELWLFEARVHQQVYPSFVTTFARRFLPLSPDLGGTPAGAGALDREVLRESFDPGRATGVERARYAAVFTAADDWATAVGTILAHEIGHTVGLTASGTGSAGLHGDASLHNAGANTTDVMAPAIGFDAMVALDFAFRDLNLAYLRQRVLLR